jgi:GrpB-like predicted nucleotidyltransferase (UPF0157 family)
MGRSNLPIFQSAVKPAAEYHEWDPRYPEVFRALLADLGPLPVGVELEHVGSTAIRGCGGKGVIDLIALYPEGALEATKAWLLATGLSRQGREFTRAWPEARPMYLGWYQHQDQPFMVYVHVVSRESDEVRRFRAFRDLLASRPDLVAEYCRLKQQIVAAGVTDTDEYKILKRPFMHRALGAGVSPEA